MVGVEQAHQPSQATGRELMRDRNFTTYLVTACVSNAGSFMQAVSVPFVLYDLTGRNTWVGIGAFAYLAPALAVTPLSGTVSDRFDRRLVLLWSNVAQFASALGLFVLALSDNLTPGRIISLVVVGGVGAGFQYAAAQSIVAVLLPPEHLLQGVRLNSVGFTASRAIGPALAGFVLDWWGPKATFGLNAVSFVVFIGGLLVLRVNPVDAASRAESWVEQFRSGLIYVMKRPALRLVVISGLVVAFFGQSMVQLAAGLAKEDFGVTGRGLGLLAAVYGLGAVIASVLLVMFGDRFRRSSTALFGFALFCTGIVVTVATRHLAFGIVGFLIAGTAHALGGTSLNTSLQVQVGDEYRGRAVSMFLIALLIGMPFGALIGGWLGDRVGLRTTLLAYAGVLATYLAVAVTRLHRMVLLDGNTVELHERVVPVGPAAQPGLTTTT